MAHDKVIPCNKEHSPVLPKKNAHTRNKQGILNFLKVTDTNGILRLTEKK